MKMRAVLMTLVGASPRPHVRFKFRPGTEHLRNSPFSQAAAWPISRPAWVYPRSFLILPTGARPATRRPVQLNARAIDPLLA